MSFMPPRDHTGLEPEWNKFILQCLEIKKAKRFPNIKAIQTFFGGKVKMTPQTQQRRVSPESITRKQKD